MDVQLRILRFDPDRDAAPHWEEYVVPAEPSDRVLDLLHMPSSDYQRFMDFLRHHRLKP